MYKGHDCTLFEASASTYHNKEGVKVYSEPTAYQNGRFIGAAEACWRIFHYRMHTEQPSIVRLQVHCEGQNTVCFKDGQLIENVAKRNPTTTLLEWFKMNQSDPVAQTILYPDFPSQYVWNENTKRWRRRQASTSRGTARVQHFPTIGRMHTTQPSEGERWVPSSCST